MYLRAVTTFERFLEDLFFGLITESIISSRTVHPRVTFRSTVIARDVVFSGKSYVDWIPYDQTVKRGKAFLRSGRPFTTLDTVDKKAIERMVIIRNAVAHKSDAANERFLKEVIGSTAMLSSEKTPAGYLRAVFRISPKQTHYEEIVTTSMVIAKKLCR